MKYGNLKSEVDNSPVLPMSKTITNNISGELVLPQVASASLLLDLRASDFSGLEENASIGNSWLDHTSYHHDFTRGTGSTGLLKGSVGTINDRTYIIMNAIDDYLEGDNWSELDNLDSFAVFVASDFSPCFITKMNNSSNGAGWALRGAGTAGLLQEDGGNNWIEKNVEPPLVVSGISTMEVISKSEVHVYINNDNSSETDSSAPPISNYSTVEKVRIGTFGNLAAFYGGWMYGVLIYVPAPSAEDRALIVQWMIDNELGLEHE